jgi:hypothetical protein
MFYTNMRSLSSAGVTRALADAADAYLLVINPIIYAEVSIDADRIEDLDAELRSRTTNGFRSRTRLAFSLGRRSFATGAREAHIGHRCRTSTSGRTRRSTG